MSDKSDSDRLESAPHLAGLELAMEAPEGVEVRVVRDSDEVCYLHIPAAPQEGAISDQDLMSAQGGWIPVPLIPLVIYQATKTDSSAVCGLQNLAN